MQVLAAFLVLLVTVCAFIAAPRYTACLRWVLVLAATLAAGGLYLLFWAPRDFIIRFPAFATVLHPWLLALYVAFSLIVAFAILLAFTGRYLYGNWRRKDEFPNHRKV